MELKVCKLVDSEWAKLTTSDDDTGYDLYATESVIIHPNEAKLVPHGIAVELPPGFASMIRPRSSARLKVGVLVVPGTIDNGFRGMLHTMVENRNPHTIEITKGQRISQLVVEQVFKPEVVYHDKLSDTSRGEGGWGSTGK
jgi:dUTP pyrophosphatase